MCVTVTHANSVLEMYDPHYMRARIPNTYIKTDGMYYLDSVRETNV